MPRTAKAATHRLWNERMRRFALSGLSVAAFCRREGVSQPCFYAWRRRLRDDLPRFLPVRVVQPTTAPVEVLLPSGCVLRLSPGCELAWVRDLLQALGVSSC
jgi:transposase-like protein